MMTIHIDHTLVKLNSTIRFLENRNIYIDTKIVKEDFKKVSIRKKKDKKGNTLSHADNL